MDKVEKVDRVEKVGPHWAVLLLLGIAAASSGCSRPGQAYGPASSSGAQVFTPAHRTTVDAFKEFFGVRTRAEQPIPFPHRVHVAKGLGCTDYCHESATKGPVAGLPSVTTCMICHDAIAKSRPTILKVADYQKRGVDIPWQRVYDYPSTAHVRFNHAPHLRAGVDCSTCHGNVANQTVAERVVNLNMGFCVNCHKAKQASNDCLTCHF